MDAALETSTRARARDSDAATDDGDARVESRVPRPGRARVRMGRRNDARGD